LPERRDEATAKLDQQLKNGHRYLGTLQRANNGGYLSLTKVLLYAYGRNGSRRRELLKSLLDADGVSQNAESAFANAETRLIAEGQNGQKQKSAWDISSVPVPAVFERPKDLSRDLIHYTISTRFGRLKALAESQVRTEIPEDSRPHLKSAVYKMPAKNIWGRSMPQKRVKNLVAAWYAKLLDRIHPPLPETEWMALKELVDGTRKWEGLQKRRARPVERPANLTTLDLEKLMFYPNRASRSADTPDSMAQIDEKNNQKRHKIPRAIQNLTSTDEWLEDDELIGNTLQDALEEELQFGKRFSMIRNFKDDPHHITERFMRRIWARVFKQCSLIQKDEKSKNWVVKWGHGIPASTTSSTILPLFDLVAAQTQPSREQQIAKP
jgi:hypothetical protein